VTILLPHACTGWALPGLPGTRLRHDLLRAQYTSHTVLTRRIRDLETRRPSWGDEEPGHQESPLEKGLDHHGKPLENEKGLPAHPVEPTYPCYLSVLGEFSQVPPRGEPCIHTRAPPNPPPNPSQHSNPTAARTACWEGAAGIDTTPEKPRATPFGLAATGNLAPEL